MIVGFDHDDISAFDAIADFIAEARIANALIRTASRHSHDAALRPAQTKRKAE